MFISRVVSLRTTSSSALSQRKEARTPSPLLTHNPFSPLTSYLVPRLSLQVLIQIELDRRLRKLTQINWNKIYGTLLIRLRHRIPSILKFPRISTDFRITNRCKGIGALEATSSFFSSTTDSVFFGTTRFLLTLR